MFEADSTKWYQIYTHSNTEKKLHGKIVNLGFEAYLPVRKIKKIWSDRSKIIEEPAFKSYIFAKLDADEMRVVERLSGFCHFVRYGNNRKSKRQNGSYFPNISDQDIQIIRSALLDCPTAVLADECKLIKNTFVRIKYGCLKGYKGKLLDDSLGGKVAISLKGLERSIIITVPTNVLEVLEKA